MAGREFQQAVGMLVIRETLRFSCTASGIELRKSSTGDRMNQPELGTTSASSLYAGYDRGGSLASGGGVAFGLSGF